MRPGNWWNISNTDEETRWKNISLFLKDLYNILNRGIVFQDNVRGSLKTVDFTVADTEQEIEHGLSYAPKNYILLSTSAGANLYDGDSDTTTKVIYLKSTAVATVRVFIF